MMVSFIINIFLRGTLAKAKMKTVSIVHVIQTHKIGTLLLLRHIMMNYEDLNKLNMEYDILYN